MASDRVSKVAPGRAAPPGRRLPPGGGGAPSGRPVPLPSLAAADVLALQRLAGNRAAASRVQAARAPTDSVAPAALAVQRLEIYGRAAAESSALPADTAAEFARLVEAGSQAQALQVVVAAMTSRGELDPRLLRTSGEGDLWQIRDVGEMGAVASFRASFPDPDDASKRLPNPRFSVSPVLLGPGRSGALERLHSTLLHEYRHVEQQAERVNRPREAGAARAAGYGNDPDEFDAYLSEVESAYSAGHMRTAAVQAGVGWEFLADADKEPFRARWTAAQERIRQMLGQSVEDVLRTPMAERYRAQLRALAERAREAEQAHAR